MQGKPPAARDGHTACVIGSGIYIFGGYEEEVGISEFVDACIHYIILQGKGTLSQKLLTHVSLHTFYFIYGLRFNQMLFFFRESAFLIVLNIWTQKH